MRFKQLLTLLFINLFCIYSPSHAMAELIERMERLNISKDAQYQPTGPNYFELLPEEIKDDEIAPYLTAFNDKEDDQEFIERTETIPQGNPGTVIHYGGWEVKLHKSFLGNNYIQARHEVVGTKKIGLPYCDAVIFSCSPMMGNIVYVDDMYGGYSIFGLKRDCSGGFLIGRDEVVKAVGISEVGNWVASVEKDRKGMCIVKLFNGDENIASFPIEIPIDQVKSVAFNKQGTKIIVHGTDSYQIIPLADEATHQAKSKKTLAEYFRQKGVRKSLK